MKKLLLFLLFIPSLVFAQPGGGSGTHITSESQHSLRHRADRVIAETYKLNTGITVEAQLNNIADGLVTASVSDTAYAASWDGVTTIAASQNVLYDKIETLGGGWSRTAPYLYPTTITDNVGIGITAPLAWLQVGTSAGNPLLIIEKGGNIGIGVTSPKGLLQVGTEPNVPLIVLAGGNVGIGTTSPTVQLELSGATMKAISNTIDFSDVTDGWVLTFDTGTNTWAGEVGGAGSQTPWTANIEGAGYTLTNTGNVGIGTSTPLGLLMVGTSPNVPLIVLANGNVGIGRTNPTAPLEIVGVGGTAPFMIFRDNTNIALEIRANSGLSNIAVGTNTLTQQGTGGSNSAFGTSALYVNTEGGSNSAFGTSTLSSNTTGNENSAFGFGALGIIENGVKNIGLGNVAGAYAIGSNELFINAFDRTDYSGDQTKSIIYGLMASDEKTQKLLLNVGYLGVGVYTTNVLGSLQVGTSPSPQLVVMTTGNVGIGKTNPAYTLDVNGTANFTTLTEGGNAVYNSTEVPGGELGDTWASPTVDSTHSGSAHHSAVTLGAGNDSSLALSGQELTLTVAKDLVTTSPLTGGTDNILTGADADITIALTQLKDIVTTAPLTGGENDVLPGADADLTLAITVAKDIVAGVGLSGGEDNVLPGADADTTLTFDATELDVLTWDAGTLALIKWDWNLSGTDPALTFGNNYVSVSTGNLGVGNTAPEALLDVGTSPGVGLIVKDTGNVGIGTTNPQRKLDIIGTMRTQDTIPLMTLVIYNPATDMDAIGKKMPEAVTLDKVYAQCPTVAQGTNTLFTLYVVGTDGTGPKTALTGVGQTASLNQLIISSFSNGGTIPSGQHLIVDIESTQSATAPIFRLQVDGHES